MQNKDQLYLDIAHVISLKSYAVRLKVGCVIVKDDNIIAFGYNGTPRGFDNICEATVPDEINGLTVITKSEVIHAEMNALAKCAKSTLSCEGATLYTTDSPCPECCKLIIASGIGRVVYMREFRDTTGLDWLRKSLITIRRYDI